MHTLASFDRVLFSAAIATHMQQQDVSMREAARESGVSASTFSRIIAGKEPDMDSFARLCDWASLDANSFLGRLNTERRLPKKASILSYVCAAISIDETLTPAIQQALIQIIQLVYRTVASK